MIRLFFKLPFCARRAFFIAIRLSHFAHIPHKSSIKILLPLLTFLPIEEIEAMESWEGAQLNVAKEKLAFELTAMVHGEEEAQKALDASKALFSAGGNTENMPSTQLGEADLDENGSIQVADLLVKTELAPSKAEAKRLIKQGGISVNDEKVTAFDAALTKEDFAKGEIIVKKGKKVFHKVTLA